MNISLEVKNLSKNYTDFNSVLTILKDINLKVHKGESVAIIGPSGSGKTTLLQILGLISKPTTGEIFILDKNCTNLNQNEINQILMKEIAFIYQFHHLFPEFSVLENVMIPLLINGIDKLKAKEQAIEVLQYLKLDHRMASKPFMLSGGEQQRVAIARVIVKKPLIMLADEPTGNLDPNTAKIVFDLLINSSKNNNSSLICVTHNYEIAKTMDRCFTMKDGILEEFK